MAKVIWQFPLIAMTGPAKSSSLEVEQELFAAETVRPVGRPARRHA